MNVDASVVVLLSGGIDSTTLLWSLRSSAALALAVDYGQRHKREVGYARRIAELAGVEFMVYAMPGIQSIKPPVPDGHYAETSMKATVYPNRNMILLAIAAGIAIDRGCDAVAYAAHTGDHTIYPDCRPEFVEALQHALTSGNWSPIRVLAPFVQKTKAEIVRIGSDLQAPLGITWSCYRGRELHCGTCGTCVERKEAFSLAGVTDPTSYYKMGGCNCDSHRTSRSCPLHGLL